MELTVIVLITALLFAWALVSARLQQADLTAPIVFTAVGAALAWSGLVNGSVAPGELSPRLSRSPWCGCSSPTPPACRSSNCAGT